MDKKTALVFCPCISGGRQVYCCVISDWFLRSGFEVILAVGRDSNGELALKTPLINLLAQRPKVTILDLGDTEGSHLIYGKWIAILKGLENKFQPEWTFFPLGDEIRHSLAGLEYNSGPRRLKRAAIFIRFDYCYLRDVQNRILLDKLIEWYGWYKIKHKENLYFKKTVLINLGLNVVFSTNPDFMGKNKNPHIYYLPEIYKAWGFSIPEKDEQAIQHLCMEYRNFLNNHIGKEVILYLGGWTTRRGYDKLLNLACNIKDTIFVSCGRPTSYMQSKYDITVLREELKRQNRIFEVEIPMLPENEFFDLLYNSCNFVLLPYDNFYSISSIMVQATSYGKPVLSPSIGYFNSIIKQHRIGLAYKNNDEKDFIDKFQILRRTFSGYSDNAARFGKSFDIGKIEAALTNAVFKY